jgi:hypothetical protein
LNTQRNAHRYGLEKFSVRPGQHEERETVQKVQDDQGEDGDVERERDLMTDQE